MRHDMKKAFFVALRNAWYIFEPTRLEEVHYSLPTRAPHFTQPQRQLRRPPPLSCGAPQHRNPSPTLTSASVLCAHMRAHCNRR